MAEVARQSSGQHLDVPNINIQPASSGEDDSSSENEEDIPKPREKGEAEGESEDTGDDTSTWDSDPAMPTPRSSREYYPLKGSSEKIYPSQGGDSGGHDSSSGTKTGYSVDLYLKTLSGHLGEGDSNRSGSDESNLSGIPFSAARRVVDGGEETETLKGREKELNDNDDTNDENEEEEELKRLQEDGEDYDDEEEDIEKLDLTKQQHRHFGRGVAPDARVMFVPSLDALGRDPISTLMSQLIGNQPSLFHSQDGSSTEDEGANPQGVVYGKSFEGSEDGGSEVQLQKWEELFQLLEIQHQQQLTLQSEQHERRMEHLRQLMTQQQLKLQELKQFNSSPGPGGVNPQTDQPPQIGTPQYVPGLDNEDVTSPRNQYSTAKKHGRTTGHEKNHDLSDSDDDDDDDSDVSNHGNLHAQKERTESATGTNPACREIPSQVVSNSADLHSDKNQNQTKMTTWSDVKGQKSGAGSQRSRPAGERNDSTGQLPEESGVSKQTDISKPKEKDETVPRSYIEELEHHYQKEKESLQKRYEDQLQALQQQWYQLQQQQQEQQQVLHHLLARQQERIEHQQRSLDKHGEKAEEVEEEEDRTPTGSPDHMRERSDSDVSSTTYSNFTYWRLKEEDTYKALPASPAKEDDQIPTDEDKLAPSLRLKEKHSRHVADLKAYYESEIQELRAQLAKASSLKDYSPSKAMERTNERLQQNCAKLEAALKFANSRIQDLEKTVAAVGARLREQPAENASTTNTISSLQQTTEDLKQLCRQKQAEVLELEKRNRKLQASLEQAYQLQDIQAKEDNRDQRMLNRVMSEYKTLAQDHELARAQLSATEMQLYDAKTEAANLKSQSGQYLKALKKEKKLLSTQPDTNPNLVVVSNLRKVAHLEVEVKRLNHELNKLQYKETLSGSGSIFSDPGTRQSFTNPPPVEKRKFLKPTAGYNVFTGEEIMDDTSSDSLPQASDTESSQDRSAKAPSRLPENNKPTNLTLQPGPFDSDLEDRPLSPMMKAAEQFKRWQDENEQPGEESAGGLELQRIVSYSESSLSDEDNDVTMQNVSTQTQNGIHAGSQLDTRPFPRQQSAAGLPSRGGRSGSETPTIDSSIHIWPESEPKISLKSPISKPPERKIATSPRQLARQSLAKYAKTQSPSQSATGTSNQSRGQSVSPRRNLAFQFQEAAEHERGSPLGSLSLSEKVESPRTGSGQQAGSSSTSSRYSARRGLLEGREGLSSASPPTRSVTHMPAEKESAVENTLARVRAGDIFTRPDWQNGTAVQKSRFSPQTPKNPEEIGHKIIQKLEEHEKRLDELMMEKRKLESALSHLPTSGRGTMQQQEKLEDELEKVTRELGSVRMLLRKYNALKTS